MTKSKIEWTDEVWNPTVGCRRVSEGCRNCYAERMAKRLAAMGRAEYQGLLTEGGRWLCKDDEEIQRVILDLQARKKSLDERISALRTAMSAQIRNQGRQLNFWR